MSKLSLHSILRTCICNYLVYSIEQNILVQVYFMPKKRIVCGIKCDIASPEALLLYVGYSLFDWDLAVLVGDEMELGVSFLEECERAAVLSQQVGGILKDAACPQL